LLFDDANLPVIDGAEWAKIMHQTGGGAAIESTDSIDLANNNIEFFWAMALIVAKYIFRGEHETVEYLINMIARTLKHIGDQLEIDVPEIEPIKFDGETSREFQFESLRTVATLPKSMESSAASKGTVIPSAVIKQIEAFIEACEGLAK
jgi:hypothetical protein